MPFPFSKYVIGIDMITSYEWSGHSPSISANKNRSSTLKSRNENLTVSLYWRRRISKGSFSLFLSSEIVNKKPVCSWLTISSHCRHCDTCWHMPPITMLHISAEASNPSHKFWLTSVCGYICRMTPSQFLDFQLFFCSSAQISPAHIFW